jgi:hypothetical protein
MAIGLALGTLLAAATKSAQAAIKQQSASSGGSQTNKNAAVNDYSATANKNSAEYKDAGNWTGGAVGQGAYTYPTWLESMVSNDKLYADTNREQGYWSPQAEAELAFRSLSSAEQQKAAAQLGNQGTYFDSGAKAVKNADGSIPADTSANTAAETLKAAAAQKQGAVATQQGTPAKAALNGQQLDVIIGADGRSTLSDGSPIKAGTIVTAAGNKQYMRLSDGTSIPIAYIGTIKRENENGQLVETNRPVYFDGNGRAYDANGNRVAQGDIVQDKSGKMWIMQGSQGVPYVSGQSYGTVNRTPSNDALAANADNRAETLYDDPNMNAQLKQISDLVSAMPDITAMMEQGMTFEQAYAMAQRLNSPLYKQAMEDSMNDITERALMSGFYGQIPTDALRLQTMAKLESDKITANNTLATELRDQNIDEIYKRYNALSDQQKAKIDNYLAMLGIYTDYTRDARDYAADRADTAWNQAYQEKSLAQQQQQWQSEFDADKLLSQLGYDLDVANLTGMFNGQPTLDYLDYQRLLNSAKSGGSGSEKPSISESAARLAMNNGTASRSDVAAYDYYHGTNYAELYDQLEAELSKSKSTEQLKSVANKFIANDLPLTIVEPLAQKWMSALKGTLVGH